MTSPSKPLPLVSVIVPTRNEADFIERCLYSILGNEYPGGLLEVLVVDGMSTDATRDIVQTLCREDGRVRLVDNPQRIVPYAMNLGIRHARGEVVLRIDGHAVVPTDFIRQSVQLLLEHDEAWCAGGAVETVSTGVIGRVIAAAMSSPLGVGNSMFRLGTFDGYVDTIAFGVYWRWVFDRIGFFDEELVRNQDDELNLRLVLAGGKIVMSSRVRCQYYSRTSLRQLARQYYQYGFWRVRTIQKHRRPATLRQVVPLVFVCTWVLLLAAATLSPPLSWGLVGFAVLYLLTLAAGAVHAMRRSRLTCGPLVAVVFPILHFSYGIGSLAGVLYFVLLRGQADRLADQTMSR